ncbi:MAG: hypothetical protein ACI8PZ_005030 [Myxococcota bacterium]|jgi:hypothetical protein
MFEASRSRGSVLPLAVVAGALAVGAGWWMTRESAPGPALDLPAVVAFDGTAEDAARHLETAAAAADVALWHLECDALPCLAVVRLDSRTHGARRVALERELADRGWALSPAGIVHVLDAFPPDYPARVVYTLALSAAPLSPDERAPVKERLRALAGEGDTAHGPW